MYKKLGIILSVSGVLLALINATYFRSDTSVFGIPLLFILSAILFVAGILVVDKRRKETVKSDGNQN